MPLLSKPCTYGILAVLYVASKGEKKFVSIREISEEINISFHFLTKILQILTRGNIMTSYKGPKGGVALAKDIEEINILGIIQAIDGSELFEECILGIPGCGGEEPCPLHNHWATIREDLKTLFEGETLADMASRVHGFRLRLSDKE
jgi:Rrf2 family protein